MTMTAVEMLARLVGFDTTSRVSNLALIDWVEAYLADLGAMTQRVVSPDGQKANLHAIIGPQIDGGVVLSGHTDVVPVDGQAWDSDPFVVTEKDARLYGRGTCDMKGFIACALAAAPDFAKANLKRPVHFALSYDEEVGCIGAPALIEAITAGGPRPSAVIVGEPTMMQVVSGHKGLYSIKVIVRGFEAHSSLVESGACAVTYATELMHWIVEEAKAMKAKAPADSAFSPPYGTVTIGQVHGGSAINILAKDAWFESLMRPAPWDDGPDMGKRFRAFAAEIEAEMRRYAPSASITIEQISDVPPLRPESEGEAETLARALTGDNSPRVVPYGTEGGQFQQGGLSTVICGPGSIDQAHQPNEFVALSQIHDCVGFMKKLENRLSQ